MVSWKQTVRLLGEQYQMTGGGLIATDGGSLQEVLSSNTHTIVNVTAESDLLTIPGKEFHPRKVRGYLWTRREDRALQRKESVIWAAYDEEGKQTLIGIGAIVEREVASRLIQRRPDKFMVIWGGVHGPV